jgi:hypothetical protein
MPSERDADPRTRLRGKAAAPAPRSACLISPAAPLQCATRLSLQRLRAGHGILPWLVTTRPPRTLQHSPALTALFPVKLKRPTPHTCALLPSAPLTRGSLVWAVQAILSALSYHSHGAGPLCSQWTPVDPTTNHSSTTARPRAQLDFRAKRLGFMAWAREGAAPGHPGQSARASSEAAAGTSPRGPCPWPESRMPSTGRPARELGSPLPARHVLVTWPARELGSPLPARQTLEASLRGYTPCHVVPKARMGTPAGCDTASCSSQ